jgi:hypothetical protein
LEAGAFAEVDADGVLDGVSAAFAASFDSVGFASAELDSPEDSEPFDA